MVQFAFKKCSILLNIKHLRTAASSTTLSFVSLNFTGLKTVNCSEYQFPNFRSTFDNANLNADQRILSRKLFC